MNSAFLVLEDSDPRSSSFYYVEQKKGVRGCYRAGICWHTVFLHSTVHIEASADRFQHCLVKTTVS